MLVQERPEDENPPKAEDDARDGREQLDHRAHRGPQHARSELAQEEPDCDRQGHRDEQRHEGGDERPEDQVGRAVRVLDGVPHARSEEPGPELLKRGLGLVDDLDDEEDHQRRQPQSGEPGDALEDDVADPPPAAALRGTWAVGVSVVMGIAGAEAPAPWEGGAGAPLQPVQEPILAISAWSLVTIEDGSFGYPRSGPKPWPVGPIAYCRNAFSVEALGESCGTMTYVNVASG